MVAAGRSRGAPFLRKKIVRRRVEFRLGGWVKRVSWLSRPLTAERMDSVVTEQVMSSRWVRVGGVAACLVAAAGAWCGLSAVRAEPAQKPDELAKKAEGILHKNCYECHGDPTQTIRGKLNLYD